MFGGNSAWGQNNQQQQQQPQQGGGLFGGGGGGFGQPQQQNTGFGATTSTFGQPAQQNTGGLFGGGAQANTGFSFGSNNAAQTSTFGARPGFGSTGTSTFGQPAQSSGGMFGASTQPTTTFGATNTTNSLFGKPATASTGFGSGATSSLFGAKPAFGAPSGGTTANGVNIYTPGPFPPPPQTGTAQPPYQPTWQQDPSTTTAKDGPPHLFHSISAMDPYKGASWEELRALDYQQGRKDASSSQQAAPAGGFGAPAAGGFGQPAATNTFGAASTSSPFGAPKPAGLFGSTTTPTSTFGQQPATTGFGAAATNTGGGLFGQQPQQPQQSGGLFGQAATNTTSTGGLFGQTQQNQQTGGGLFGGASSSTGGGLFGQNNQQQQQQPAQTGGFGFGQPKPAFGSTAPATTFGQPAASTGTGLFGQPAQNTATNTGFSFGQAQPAQQQQQQPAAGGGLFGGGGGFGQTNTQTTGTGLFGQQNQQQQQGQQPATGGLFGNTAAKPGGLFGSAAPATQPSTGFSFGSSNTTQPAAGGGLFGAASTTQPAATGGLFGQPAQANAQQPAQTGGLFGGGATGGTGLFGAKPATTGTTGGLFGAAQPAQQPAQTGTGLFGSTTSTGTGLFGSTTNNALGQQNQQAAKPAGTGLFGGGSLFGNTTQPAQLPAAGGGLFGNLGQSQTSTGLFGSTNQAQTQPAAGGGLFGNLGQSTLNQSQQLQQPQQQQMQPTLTASIDQNPYGTNSLFTYTGQKLDYGSQNKKPALPPITSSTFRLTPSKKSQVNKLRGFASPLATPASPARSGSPLGGLSTPTRSVIGSPASDRYKGLADVALTPNAFVPRPSIKKLTVTPKALSLSNSDDHLESVLGKSVLKSSASRPNGTPTRDTNGTASPSRQLDQSTSNGGYSRSQQEDLGSSRRNGQVQADTMRVAQEDRQPRKGDYWCRPKVDKLRQMSERDLKQVQNFSAGRKGYGEVTFSQPVDLTGLDLGEFLGRVIVFENMELAIYPDDGPDKPPVGKGLNVPARITLENVFPKDKASKQPITDVDDPRHARFLKRIKALPDTEFVSYTDDGSWTFTVQHFSRYGIRDSDAELSGDEGEASGDDAPEPEMSRQAVQKRVAARRAKEEEAFAEADAKRRRSPSGSEDDDDDGMPPTKSMYYAGSTSARSSDEDVEGLSGERSSESQSADEEDDGDDDLVSEGPTATSSRSTGSATEMDWDEPIQAKLGYEGMRNIREMQSSFFGTGGGDAVPGKDNGLLRSRRIAAQRTQQGFGKAGEANRALGPRPVKRASAGELSGPPKYRQKVPYAKVPLEKSLVFHNEGVRADAGLAMGRSFRCSWGPNGELVHFGKVCAPSTMFESAPSANVYIQPIDLLAGDKAVEKAKADRLLSLHLRRSVVERFDGAPAALIDASIRFRDFAHLFDGGDRSQEANAFRLGCALFDEIDLGLGDLPDLDLESRISEIRRKLALSKWLEDAVSPAVDHDLVNTESQPKKVFAMLTGNQVDRAVQAALDGNDLRLATLLAQIGGPDVFKAEIMKQLDDWNKYKATPLISKEYRKVYALLAGITDISAGDIKARGADHAPDVLISEGLDWKRAFGLRLWFGAPFEETIAGVFDMFTTGLQSDFPPSKPLPPYLEKPTNGENRWKMPSEPTDMLFNLIKLYADPTVTLENVLRARDASASPTDYRLPWHLYILLSQVLSKRDFADRDEFGHSGNADMITQAYAAQLEGMGEWRWAAFVLLHLETVEERELALKALLHRHPDMSEEDEEYLTSTLQIPETWINEAFADELAAEGDAFEEYHERIAAKQYDRAHRLLVTKLAPEAVLRGDLATVRKLCLELDEINPSGWAYGGELFLDYVRVVTSGPQLLVPFRVFYGNEEIPQDTRALHQAAQSCTRLLQLLPSLFPDKQDPQQVATLSDMLSAVHQFALELHAAGYLNRPAVSPLLVDIDRLHLLQSAALDSFSRSLETAVAAAA